MISFLKFTQCSLLKYSSPLNDHSKHYFMKFPNDHPASLREYSSAPTVTICPNSLERERASLTHMGKITRQKKNFREDHCGCDWALPELCGVRKSADSPEAKCQSMPLHTKYGAQVRPPHLPSGKKSIHSRRVGMLGPSFIFLFF